MLHFELNKPEYNLTNGDIEKSAPCVNQFKSTRGPSNPLNPNYKLQSFDYVKPEPTKFIRDQMNIDDLKGAHPRGRSTKPYRDLMNISDIEGSQARDRTFHRKSPFNNIDYKDVTMKHWETTRSPNPLQPEYTVRDKIAEGDFMKMTQTGLNASYGPIDHNKPCALPRPMGGTRNLETADIKGGMADTKLLGAFTHYSRRAEQVRPVGRNDDVEGSKCGTMLRGIQTIRHTNPLMPRYEMPGNATDGAKGLETNNPYANKAKTGA